MPLTDNPDVGLATNNKFHAHELNRALDKKHVNELAKSTAQLGQSTAVIVRIHPSKKGHFELAAGVHRVAALTKNSMDVRYECHPLTDKEIAELVVIENLQHEQVDPFEEAKMLKEVASNGGLIDFAKNAGKTQKWLKSRMALANVAKDVLKFVRKERWALECIEVLGDAPHVTQRALIEGQFSYHPPNDPSDIRRAVERNAIPLVDVDWMKDPDTFNGKCKETCISSDSDMMFPVSGKGCANCMNPDCYKTRHRKYLGKHVAGLIEARGADKVLIEPFIYNSCDPHPTGVTLTQNYAQKVDLGKKATAAQIKKTPEKVRYWIVRNTKHKITVWPFIPKSTKKKDSSGNVTTATGQARKPMATREEKLHGKRTVALHARVLKALKEWTGLSLTNDDILILAAAFGTRDNCANRNLTHCGGDRWKQYWDDKGFAGMGMLDSKTLIPAGDLVLKEVKDSLVSRLDYGNNNPTNVGRDKKLAEELAHVSQLIDFDIEATRKEVNRELLPPKSWRELVNIDTLKPKNFGYETRQHKKS